MGAVIGLVIGYALGARAGDDAWGELRESWRTITTSEEVRDFLVGGVSLFADLVQRGSGMLAERLEQPGSGPRLRGVA